MAGHGVGVAWTCVPGRGGDDLVGRDLALAQFYPVHQGAAGGVGVAESLRVGVDVFGPRRLECWLAEAGLKLVQPLAHQGQVRRGTGPANELPDKGAGAVYRYEVGGQRIAREKQLRQGPKLHDPVIVAVARGGCPAVGLRSASVRFYHRLPGVLRAHVAEPGEPGVLADQCVVELVAVTVEQNSAVDQRPGRRVGVPIEPAAQEVLAAVPDTVQPGRRRGEPGEQRNHAVRVLFLPRVQLLGRGELGPLTEISAEDGGRIPGGVVVHRRAGTADLAGPYRAGGAPGAEGNRMRPLAGERGDDAQDPL